MSKVKPYKVVFKNGDSIDISKKAFQRFYDVMRVHASSLNNIQFVIIDDPKDETVKCFNVHEVLYIEDLAQDIVDLSDRIPSSDE